MPKRLDQNEYASYQVLFKELVGDPESVDQLKFELGCVAAEAFALTHDPSTPRSRKRIRTLNSWSPSGYDYSYTLPPDPYRAIWMSLRSEFQNHDARDGRMPPSFLPNAVIGPRVFLSSLCAVGRIFATKTDGVPQYKDNVSAAVAKMTRWTMKTVYSDERTFERNWNAMATGCSPYNPFNRLIVNLRQRRLFPDEALTMSERAFNAAVDSDGQVHVQPRRDPLRFSGDLAIHGCPAASVHTSGERGSDLYLLMQTIGDVVVEDVYPRLFPIAEGGEE